MKKILFTCFFIFSFYNLDAQSQIYIDAFSGSKGQTAEFFFLSPIDDHNKWTVFSRTEMFLHDYKTEHPAFTNFNTVSYNFAKNLGLTAGTYASSSYPFSVRLGLQYFIENEEFLVYANLTSAVTKDPDAQLLVIGNYLPKLSEKWRLFTSAEFRTAISYKDGHQFSLQTFKLGAKYNSKITFGITAALEEHRHHETELNIGPFINLNLTRSNENK
ncbi:hypothetical protein [Chryseobacterium viscerum]|uniref:DUF5020 domain-containing protein n=1 Tax=Chryseobacterium viscerum TaxID=1037377 RepID=A0A316WKW2_9FLAO|nr:hypothetical protein [Chryseobacterium viscerum]PWN59808.1 hypothetical protein C1634_017445 [Chryseobacterium viscerum]